VQEAFALGARKKSERNALGIPWRGKKRWCGVKRAARKNGVERGTFNALESSPEQ